MRFNPRLFNDDSNNNKHKKIDPGIISSPIKLTNAKDNLVKSFKNIDANVALLKGSMTSININDIQFTNYLPEERIEFISSKNYDSIINFLNNPRLINKFNKSIDLKKSTGNRLKKIMSKYLDNDFIDSHTEVIREADVNFGKYSNVFGKREAFRLFMVYAIENIAKENEKQWFVVMFFDPYHLVFPDRNVDLNREYDKRKHFDKSFNDYFKKHLGNINIIDLDNFS